MKITDNIHYNNHENMSRKYVSQTIDNIMITIHLYNIYNDFLCQKLADLFEICHRLHHTVNCQSNWKQ